MCNILCSKIPNGRVSLGQSFSLEDEESSGKDNGQNDLSYLISPRVLRREDERPKVSRGWGCISLLIGIAIALSPTLQDCWQQMRYAPSSTEQKQMKYETYVYLCTVSVPRLQAPDSQTLH